MKSSDVIIVGGSRGIGGALVADLRQAGRRVIHGSRSSGESVDSCQVDLSTGNGLPDLLKLSDSDQVLVIVTAGILGPIGRVEKTSISDWQATINVNLLGAIRVYKECSEAFGSTAKIVFMSGGGVGGPKHQSRVLPYTVSKTALCAFVEEVAREPRSSRPLVTALAPGAFPTGFTSAIGQTDPDIAGTELLEEYGSMETKPFDLKNISNFLDFLESPSGEAADGRMLSANRDSFKKILDASEATKLLTNSFGRLRRIDHDLFNESSFD